MLAFLFLLEDTRQRPLLSAEITSPHHSIRKSVTAIVTRPRKDNHPCASAVCTFYVCMMVASTVEQYGAGAIEATGTSERLTRP